MPHPTCSGLKPPQDHGSQDRKRPLEGMGGALAGGDNTRRHLLLLLAEVVVGLGTPAVGVALVAVPWEPHYSKHKANKVQQNTHTSGQSSGLAHTHKRNRIPKSITLASRTSNHNQRSEKCESTFVQSI